MRLSTKGRYAVMAMADLARHGRSDAGEGRAVSLAEIATRQEISLSYLEQLFARLRKSGLVRSVRGPGGGYRLAKTAGETVVSEIVLAVDEPIRAVRCTAHGTPRGCMLGGFLLGIIESMVGLWHAELREISIFLLIIVVLVVKPEGLLGQRVSEEV